MPARTRSIAEQLAEAAKQPPPRLPGMDYETQEPAVLARNPSFPDYVAGMGWGLAPSAGGFGAWQGMQSIPVRPQTQLAPPQVTPPPGLAGSDYPAPAEITPNISAPPPRAMSWADRVRAFGLGGQEGVRAIEPQAPPPPSLGGPRYFALAQPPTPSQDDVRAAIQQYLQQQDQAQQNPYWRQNAPVSPDSPYYGAY